MTSSGNLDLASSPYIGPIVKWPGGKSRHRSTLLSTFPPKFNRYYEPFLGSAAIFLGLRPLKATIADCNPDLINFYVVLRDAPQKLYMAISKMANDSRTYYATRSARPRSSFRRAVHFYYLNKTCFGGLYRTNRQGVFNVPFANNGRAVLPTRDCFFAVSDALKRGKITLKSADFDIVCSPASDGDLVYFDPPYTVAHNNNGFIRYNSQIFSWPDQVRLHNLVDRLTLRGVYVVMTNADHSSIRDLYNGYNMSRINRASTLAADPASRKRVDELLITNY